MFTAGVGARNRFCVKVDHVFMRVLCCCIGLGIGASTVNTAFFKIR